MIGQNDTPTKKRKRDENSKYCNVCKIDIPTK